MSDTKNVAAEPLIRAQARAGKYVTFFLGGEEYGIEILHVHEIIGVLPITPVPRTPEYIEGVINLRGKVIPVIDVRKKFDMEPHTKTDETCIIVLRVDGIETGIIVDRVSEVLDIAAPDIDAPPKFGDQVDEGYLLGVAKGNGKVRLLLDIAKVLNTKDALAIRDEIEAATA